MNIKDMLADTRPVTEEYLLGTWGGKYYDESLVIRVGKLFFRVWPTGCYRVAVGGEYRHDFTDLERINSISQFNMLMMALGYECPAHA